MLNLVLSVLMLAGILLLVGAWLAFRQNDMKRMALMLVLALAIGVNVGIWTLPSDSGTPPAEATLR
ncbi:hypothetical protein RM533_05150 [Croceicoccus sp. F390]|uniref:Uncharacterized protein n=1 Tax=Croceicoccus esteveae TaxID=3075597 RepID=A0ABU2ZGP3_9SPHN|nr:hypothetical protein [Croceicoccus sp. F390]MDT0575565.1 hypothetical protein [Croceicoccus sp. F390]